MLDSVKFLLMISLLGTLIHAYAPRFCECPHQYGGHICGHEMVELNKNNEVKRDVTNCAPNFHYHCVKRDAKTYPQIINECRKPKDRCVKTRPDLVPKYGNRSEYGRIGWRACVNSKDVSTSKKEVTAPKIGPKKGVATPKKGVATPKEAVATPKNSAAAPYKGVAALKKGVATPSKGVATPKKGVAIPKNVTRNRTKIKSTAQKG